MRRGELAVNCVMVPLRNGPQGVSGSEFDISRESFTPLPLAIGRVATSAAGGPRRPNAARALCEESLK
jgi:hypothetical protein